MAKESKRRSGIELLRILSALFVVMLHYNDGRAFAYVTKGSLSQYALLGVESIGICAVNLFVLISGYFLSGSQKRSVLKPFELLVQVMAFSEARYILMVLQSEATLNIKDIVYNALPNSYFVILYAVVYLISPYMNVVFKNLSQKKWNQFVGLLLLLFSVWPVIVDLSEEVLGREWFGFSTIAAWGSQQGFNVVHFSLMYILGGYLRYHGIPEKYNKKRLLIPAWLLTVAGIFLWALITENMTRMELRSAWVYHNPLVILSAVLLFCIFAKLDFSSKLINRLAGAAFTNFLLHSEILGIFAIETAINAGVGPMLMHVIFVAISCYILAWIAHEIYHFMTDWAFKKLSNIQIFANKEVV